MKTSSSFHLHFCWYLHLQFVSTNITDGFKDENSLSKKLSSVIYGLSVINIPMDLQMNKARQKYLHASFYRYLHW